MKGKGHDFLITARDKEITHKLLEFYGIEYINRGRGRTSLLGKVFYLILTDIRLVKVCFTWKPDVFLSFGSPYAAHAAKILNRPHIALTDTEHAKLGILSFAAFSETIITPQAFYKSFNRKQIKFNGFFELSYLHPRLFKKDNLIREQLNLCSTDKFVLLRFVSWGASHDLWQSGISDKMKIKIIDFFINSGYKIFISSEGKILHELEKYILKISPEKIHSVLSEADLFIGESGTMATEASLLGTPSVYVNSLDAGVFHDEVKYGLLYSFRADRDLLNVIRKLSSDHNLKQQHYIKKEKMLTEKIDITSFLVWFIESYPESRQIMKDNPDYQYNFK